MALVAVLRIEIVIVSDPFSTNVKSVEADNAFFTVIFPVVVMF